MEILPLFLEKTPELLQQQRSYITATNIQLNIEIYIEKDIAQNVLQK